MCKFVPERMFSVTDIEGRTPLHLAVEYERCCKTQVGIVNSLLLWGPRALHIPISPRSSGQILSIYQYHKISRKQSRRRKPPLGFPDGKPSQEAAAEESRPGADAAKAALKYSASMTGKNNTGPPPRSLRKKCPESSAPLPGLKRKVTMKAPPTSRARDDPTPRVAVLDTQHGVLSNPEESTVRLMKTPQAQEEETNEASEKIAELLKLSYLRTGSPHDASRALRLDGEIGSCRLSLFVLYQNRA